jgi:hypothetical protein
MNTQLVEFKSKLCTQDRHWMCSRQWEGLGIIALCNCACHEKKEDVSSDVSGIASVIH